MSRYRQVFKIKDLDKKNRMYANIQYPEVHKEDGDLYIYATGQDRYDTLAKKYYETEELWYIIALANVDSGANIGSLYPPQGKRIRIPASPFTYESKYEIEVNRRLFIEQKKISKPLITGYTKIKLY
jgi:hypothetical protein